MTDHEIREEVAQGAKTLKDIKSRLGVASQCAQCAKQACEVIREADQAIMNVVSSNEAHPFTIQPFRRTA